MIFSLGRVRRYPNFTFRDSKLEVCDDYAYLGVVFNYNGTFKKAIDKQVSQTRRAMFLVVKKTPVKLQLPIDIQCQLFDHLVLPNLLYGSEVWCAQDLKAYWNVSQKIFDAY